MSFQPVLPSPSTVSHRRRLGARLAVGTARLLTHLPPRRLCAVMALVARGAVPATREQAQTARDAIAAVSLVCAGREGCLPRSVAAALLCRAGGAWPTWCVGVRSAPPFTAHAWVEVDGHMVGEGVPDGYFRVLMSVPPSGESRGAGGDR